MKPAQATRILQRRKSHLEHRIQSALNAGETTNQFDEAELAALESAIEALSGPALPMQKKRWAWSISVAEATALSAGTMAVFTQVVRGHPLDPFTDVALNTMLGAGIAVLATLLTGRRTLLTMGAPIAAIACAVGGIEPALAVSLGAGVLSVDLIYAYASMRKAAIPFSVRELTRAYLLPAKNHSS